MVRLEQLDKVQARRAKERSEWARRTEERRLDKLKAYSVAEEIQSLGQRKADLVDKMIQDLFALTPEWEVRRMKVRAVSFNTLHLASNCSCSRDLIPSPVQSQRCECKNTLDQPSTSSPPDQPRKKFRTKPTWPV